MTTARLLLAAAGGSGAFPVTPEPPEPPTPPTSVAKVGSRVELFTRANTYAQGIVEKDGTVYLFTTESPSTEHAAGSGAYVRTASASDDLTDPDSWSARTLLYDGSGAGRHGNCEAVFLTSTGRILVALDDQADVDQFDVIAKVIYSDDGSSWSSPYTVPNSFSGDCVGGDFVEMPDGDILHFTYGEQTGVVGGNTFVRRVRSSDGGETFGSEVTVAASASRVLHEPNAAYVDGKVRVFMRSDTNVHTWYVESSDGDAYNSPTDVVALSGPPDFIEFFVPGYLFMLARNNNTVWRPRWSWSADGGISWATITEVDSGETRELDGTAILMTGDLEWITVYSLANSLSSNTVYIQQWAAS